MLLLFLTATLLLASNAVHASHQKPRAIQYSNVTSAAVSDLSTPSLYSSSSPSYAVPSSTSSSSQSSSAHSYTPSGLVTAPAPASSHFVTIASTTGTNHTTQSPPSTTAGLNSTLAFCCAQLYQPGIGLVAWYTGPQIYATVATLVSVYAQYNNTKVLESVHTVNSTNATAYYGSHGVVGQFGSTTTTVIPGLPNTLVPFKDNLYGATVIGTQTEIVFPNQSLTITSPTPFWVYASIPFMTGASTAGHNDTMCTLVPTKVPDAAGTGTSTAYVTTASPAFFGEANFNLQGPLAFPYDGNVSSWLSSADGNGVYGDAVGDVDVTTPNLIKELADIPFAVSQFPQVASCVPIFEGEGAPTVHVPVSELTATSESVVTRTGIYSAPSSIEVLQTASGLTTTAEPGTSTVEILGTAGSLGPTTSSGSAARVTTTDALTAEILGTAGSLGTATSSDAQLSIDLVSPSIVSDSATASVSAQSAQVLESGASLGPFEYTGPYTSASTSASAASIATTSDQSTSTTSTLISEASSVEVLQTGSGLTTTVDSDNSLSSTATQIPEVLATESGLTTTVDSADSVTTLPSQSTLVPEVLETIESLGTTPAAGTTASVNTPNQSGGSTYSVEPSATVLLPASIPNTASGSAASVTATAEILGTAGALDTTATDTASVSIIPPSGLTASSAEVLGTAGSLGSDASPTTQGNIQIPSTPTAQAQNSAGQSRSPAQANGPTSGEPPATQAQPSWVSTIVVQPAGSGQTFEGGVSAGAVGASVPAPAVTIGSATVTQNSASQYVVPASVAGGQSDQTLVPGGSAVTDASGNTYSVPSAGTAVVVNGQTSAIVTPAGAVVTIGSGSDSESGSGSGANSVGSGIPATPVGSSGEYIVAGQTLSPGGSAVIASGATFSLPSAGADNSGAVVVNGATSALPTIASAAETSAVSFGGAAATPIGSSGEYIVAGQTVSPGGPAVIVSGATYSLASASAGNPGAVIINGVTSALPTVATSAGSSAVRFEGVTATPVGSSGGYVIAGQTVSSGGSAIVVSGTTYSLASGSPGSPGAVVVNGATSQIPAAAETAANSALAGVSTTAIPEYMIGGSTLVPGSPALTISGSTISLGADGSSVYINGQASAIGTDSGSSPSTNVVSIAGVAATPSSGSAYLISGQTLLPGGSALTVSGTTYSLPPLSSGSSGYGSAIVVNGVTTSLPQNGVSSGASVITIASSTYAISQTVVSGTTEVVIGGSQTLAPGSVVTAAGGSVLSLASGGSGILLGSGTVSSTASGSTRSSSSFTAASGPDTTGNAVSRTSTKSSSGAAAAAVASPGGFAEDGSTGGSIVGLLFAVAAWIMI